MYGNYNPYGYQPQYQQQPQAGFSARAVTSREEAIAAQVDFTGPGVVMPDLSHGMVYLKRFNPQTGGADFFSFRYEEPPKQDAPGQELDGVRARLDRLEAEIEKLRAGGENHAE